MRLFGSKNRRVLLNSFWLSFAGATLISQAVLAYLVLFVLMRPTVNMVAQTMVALQEAVLQIKTNEKEAELSQLEQTIENLNDISLLGFPTETQPEVFFDPTIMAFESIVRQEGHDINISYSINPKPAWHLSKKSDPTSVLTIYPADTLFSRRYLFWSILIPFLIILYGAYWITTRLASPISKLSDQAKLLTSDDSIKQIEVSPLASPEIRELANSLNSMKKKLDSSVVQREEFLSMVGHDIRTPLSRMAMWLDVGESDPEVLRKNLASNIEEMRSFLEQYVELVKLNHEVDEPLEIGDLGLLIAEISSRYSTADYEIGFHTEPNLTIHFKPVAFTRLVYNLLDNAIRYGSGSVSIEGYKDFDGVHLKIANPITVCRSVLGLSHAFRSASSDTPGDNSSGLGSKIVRKFAEVHGAFVSEQTVDGHRIIDIVFRTATIH